jgi:hypothetical protein
VVIEPRWGEPRDYKKMALREFRPARDNARENSVAAAPGDRVDSPGSKELRGT